MNAAKLMTFCMILSVAASYGYTTASITWKDTPEDCDVANYKNWTGVPSGVTDINWNYSTQAGYCGTFGQSYKTINLFLGADLAMERLYFQASSAKVNFDLKGHTLGVVGVAGRAFSMNASYKPQIITFSNGTFDNKGSSRDGTTWAQGVGNKICFLGTEENPFIIRSATVVPFYPYVDNGGEVVMSNVVFESAKAGVNTKTQVNSSKDGGFVTYCGSKTRLISDGVFGAGISGGRGNVLRITQGARVMITNNANVKTTIKVGGTASGSTMVLAGTGTSLSNIAHAAQSGDMSMVIGHSSNDNYLHVTDGAELYLTAPLGVGTQPGADMTRGSAAGNLVRIDTNAVVQASALVFGLMANRSDGKTTGDIAFFASNVCEIADGARVTLKGSTYEGTYGGVFLGDNVRTDYCSLSVSKKAYLQSAVTRVGYRGVSNRLDVASGGVLRSTLSSADYGLAFGGVNSTGTVVCVDGGILALTNALVKMNGSSADSTTLLRIANGSDVCARFFSLTNAGNRIEIDDAALTVRTQGRFPSAGANAVELAFAGAHPLLSYKSEDTSSTYPSVFSLSAGCSLSFVIPAGGYAEAPVASATSITVSGLTSVTIDATAFFAAGGEEQVLLESETGTISIDTASLDLLKAAAGADGRVKLSSDSKRLVLSRRKGLSVIFR